MSGWGPRVRSPGVWENTGCGTHGVRWKTQGLVETQGTICLPNVNFPYCNPQHLGLEPISWSNMQIKHFVSKKTIQRPTCCVLVSFWGIHFIFCSKIVQKIKNSKANVSCIVSRRRFVVWMNIACPIKCMFLKYLWFALEKHSCEYREAGKWGVLPQRLHFCREPKAKIFFKQNKSMHFSQHVNSMQKKFPVRNWKVLKWVT